MIIDKELSRYLSRNSTLDVKLVTVILEVHTRSFDNGRQECNKEVEGEATAGLRKPRWKVLVRAYSRKILMPWSKGSLTVLSLISSRESTVSAASEWMGWWRNAGRMKKPKVYKNIIGEPPMRRELNSSLLLIWDLRNTFMCWRSYRTKLLG